MVDVGMGKEDSVCRKVVTDTGCVYWWGHSCVRCISVHESQRLVESDPQFNLENANRHGDTLQETLIVINTEIISNLNGRNLHYFVVLW